MSQTSPSPTRIRSLSVELLNIPLHMPFGIAGGAQQLAHNLLVTLELANGTRGYGEAAPFPAFNGETQGAARAAIEALRPVLEGADVRHWRALAAVIGQHTKVGAARCALETAILDALTRHAGLPLWVFFGGACASLETDMTVTLGSLEEARKAARDIAARGMRAVKIKIGGGQALDLERVCAIHALLPGSALILDGNGAYTADYALELLAALKTRSVLVALLEQPVPRSDFAGLCRLAREAYVPVAADESVSSAADALCIAEQRAAQVLNIKLMKCGIVEALDIVAIARVAGLGMMVGGMVESVLAMSVSACFAAGLGSFSFVDLDTPLFMAENPFEGGMVYHGRHIDLMSIRAGHGVTPRR